MKKLIPSLFIYLCFASSFGQTKDTIETDLNKCLASDEGQTTSGMINCMIIARNSWDSQLNKYYNLLMNILPTDEKQKLKFSQKKWISYRDSEIEFSETLYHNINGTMWGISAADRINEIVKVRAKELESYYKFLPQYSGQR